MRHQADQVIMRRQKEATLPAWLYHTAVRRFTKYTFPIWQSMGVHMTPVHFHQPVPDTRSLSDSVWERRSELIGMDLKEEAQLILLDEFARNWKHEYEGIPRNRKDAHPSEYYINNKAFTSVDGEVLYCMIRKFRPRKIIEIGSGYSTILAAQAVIRNREESGHECELIACEPYPLKCLTAGFPGLARVVAKRVEEIPLSFFRELGQNDILFIDSSHELKIAGDVQYEFLEIIPRLAKGVLVHVHDIFLPAEYLKQWVMKERIFHNEQYVLQAFLAFNKAFQILWAASYMHLRHPEKLEAAFSSYTRSSRWPGSFWFQRVE